MDLCSSVSVSVSSAGKKNSSEKPRLFVRPRGGTVPAAVGVTTMGCTDATTDSSEMLTTTCRGRVYPPLPRAAQSARILFSVGLGFIAAATLAGSGLGLGFRVRG